jgi:hypothetical protein
MVDRDGGQHRSSLPAYHSLASAQAGQKRFLPVILLSSRSPLNARRKGKHDPGISPSPRCSQWQTCVWYSVMYMLNHGYDPIPGVSFRADGAPRDHLYSSVVPPSTTC